MIEGYFIGGPWDRQFRVMADERLEWTVAIGPELFDWTAEPDEPVGGITTGKYRRIGNVSYIWDEEVDVGTIGGGRYGSLL